MNFMDCWEEERLARLSCVVSESALLHSIIDSLCFYLLISNILQRATWHVPPGQASVARNGAAAAGDTAAPPTSSKPSISRTPSGSNLSTASSHLSPFSKPSSRSSTPTEEELTVEVALKVIPKKKVKGNESSVWGEMEVLRGLDHPNIVRIPFHHFCACCAMAQKPKRGVER